MCVRAASCLLSPMPALPRATGSPSRSSLERRVSLSAWSAGSYGSPTVYNCERSRQAHTPKSMAKPYDDDTDFTCVRRVVWKAPLTSEFFGAATETVAPRTGLCLCENHNLRNEGHDASHMGKATRQSECSEIFLCVTCIVRFVIVLRKQL